MAQTIVVSSRGKVSHSRVEKAENDVISVDVDFSMFFGSDTASSHTVTVDSGLTKDSSALAANVVTIVLSSGSNGYVYDVTVQAVGTTETKEVVFQVYVRDMDATSVNDYWFWSRS